MTNETSFLPADYWQSLDINKRDIEFLHTHLFETETPLTIVELATVFVVERIRIEKANMLKKRKGSGKVFSPKESYQVGDELTFPALNWQKGKITSIRPGDNPEVAEFDVLIVAMKDGVERQFAARLEEHALNEVDGASDGDVDDNPDEIVRDFGPAIAKELDAALRDGEELVSIAGHWFPRALLVDVNMGHLNLAEAILDMAEGEPQLTAVLMRDIDLPSGDNANLTEFSLNYALQEDPRFDEVGSAGQVLWCLERLEPEAVRNIPTFLQYTPVDLDRATLSADMLALEAKLDDELSRIELGEDEKLKKVTISLLYPHWRMGTLPISERIRSFFPTAYESPRIRFTLVDGKTGEKMPAWVVKGNRYVFGLKEWYSEMNLLPGSLIDIKPGKNPGEVIVDAQTYRRKKDWVRTVLVGADGGLVFATLKQELHANFDDRMVLAIPDEDVMDKAWEQAQAKGQSLTQLLHNMMKELTKLNPQGHIHAQELYSAINIVRRCPPAPLFSLLATQPWAMHVGDLYFRLGDETEGKE